MKLLVFAYHNIGYECLRFLIEAGEEIVAVVTHKDDPDEEVWFRSVAELAARHRLRVLTPSKPNAPAFVHRVRRLAPDLIFSFYYRRILSGNLLSAARLGGINLHGSLLPKYRGRCPINWALIYGEKETGVTLHHMTENADAGDIITQRRVAVSIEDTALTLFHKMTIASRELLKETLPLIKAGKAPRIPQDSRAATTFGGRRPEDGKIAWDQSATEIYNLVRAVTHPYPGAFTFYNGTKLTIWRAMMDFQSTKRPAGLPGKVMAKENNGIVVCTGQGNLLVTQAQFEGDKEMAAGELLEQYRLAVGTVLGEESFIGSVNDRLEGEVQ